MHEFEVGDIVRLKSDGPDMTVKSVMGNVVHCQWFAGSKLQHGNFSPESLEKVEEDEDSNTGGRG